MKTKLAFLTSLYLLCSFTWAQDWPQKPVRVIVPYAAGSAPDALARLIFDRVRENTGKPMVIENKTGASGMIGTAFVAQSAPDGYTLVLSAAGPASINKLLYKKMAYDPIKDLAPVGGAASNPVVLAVSSSVKARDARELLVEMAKPGGKMSYASAGTGTLGHMALAYLVAQSGADLPHAAYSGSPGVVTALLADDVQMAAMPPLAVVPLIKAGKLRALAVVGPNRTFLLPEVQTLKEQGIDFAPLGWFAVLTTAGTPKPVLEQIYRQMALALKHPEVQQGLRIRGMEPWEKGPDALRDFIQDEMKLWTPIISKNGIALD